MKGNWRYMQMNERIKILRKKYLDITQEEFAARIKISRSNLGSIEVGRINVTDRVVEDICTEFNVNEEWLRTGQGKMFVQPDSFSLDDYIKDRGYSELELEIVKSYFDLDKDVRGKILEHFKNKFNVEIRQNTDEIAITEDEAPISSVAEAEEKYIKMS